MRGQLKLRRVVEGGVTRDSDNPIPDYVELGPSWVRQATMAFVALIAAGATSAQIPEGMMVPLEGEKLRFAVFALYGCIALVFLLEILPQVTFVRLRRHDFQVRRFFSLTTIQWIECSEFRESEDDGTAFILPRVECERHDMKEVIPAYKVSPAELAAMMNRFRARALAEAAP